MELSENTVTDAGTAASPFSRRPAQPKPMPRARLAASTPAPQSAPSAPAAEDGARSGDCAGLHDGACGATAA